MKHVQTAFRLPEELLERLEKLAEAMSKPGLKITRTDVMRIAAFRGVEELEREHKKAKR